MKFTVEIELGNDAMQTYHHIREALAMITKGRHGKPNAGDYKAIMDENGNKVGQWEVETNQWGE